MAADPAEESLPAGDTETDPPVAGRRAGGTPTAASAAASGAGAALDVAVAVEPVLGPLQLITPRLLCTACGEGYRDPACDFTPPRCGAWNCSLGGPPCFGGEDCTCTENSDGSKRLVTSVSAAGSGAGSRVSGGRRDGTSAEHSQHTSAGGDATAHSAATE